MNMRSLLSVQGLSGWRAALGAASVITVAASASIACSSSSSPAPAAAVAPPLCPTTVEAAAGAACSTQGFVCGIGYPCGPFNQQATCTCTGANGGTGGTYNCIDATQAVVATGGTPACKAFVENATGCGATEAATNKTKCTSAGAICVFQGVTCLADAEPATDECQCVGDGDGGLAFNCETTTCDPISGIDAAVPPPPVDAGIDSGSDAAGE